MMFPRPGPCQEWALGRSLFTSISDFDFQGRKMNSVLCFLLTAACLIPAVVLADAGTGGLKVGDPVPPFTATDDQGKSWNSADYIGKGIVVVYFYPADMTGGCTKQACAFRDDRSDLADLGVQVVGVSGDSPENHRLFKQAHDLNFTLLADQQGKVAKVFGVPTKPGGSIVRQIDGQDVTLTRGVTASRWTYLIGPDGRVIMRNENVDAAADSAAVRTAVQEMRTKIQK